MMNCSGRRLTFTRSQAIAALRALCAHPAYMNCDEMKHSLRFAELNECVNAVPEWLCMLDQYTWFVRHDGSTHRTRATSEADAINNVRFNLYGRVRIESLPRFEAMNPFMIATSAARIKRDDDVRADIEARTDIDLFGKRTISKDEAKLRLRRMMKLCH